VPTGARKELSFSELSSPVAGISSVSKGRNPQSRFRFPT
jgi:hypothetical protein